MYSEWFTTTTEYSTMYHELPRDATFWLFLFSVDQDLAQTARDKACHCGGRLHRANYPRKPRGADNLPETYRYRFSFCCARDGCRQRVTPPVKGKTVTFLCFTPENGFTARDSER